MKPKIRTPYFEIGTKNYIYGDKVLKYARAADAAAKRYDIDVLFITPAVEIRRVVENTQRLIVLAPYMDTLRPGRGMADILPEALKAAGAQGVVINHCEKPMSLPQMKATIDRARELDLLVFGCADSIAETKALAELHPDIINPEPNELIGGGETGRAGTDDGDAFAASDFGDMRFDPAVLVAFFDDGEFVFVDCDGLAVHAAGAGGFTERGAYSSGELREVVGFSEP